MIVLDASVLIAYLFRQDAHHQAALTLLHDAAAEPFAASPITLAEALVVPARLGRLSAGEQLLTDLGVTEVPLPPDAAGQLAALRSDTGLKMPDCCVLLAAHIAGAVIATFDDRLATAAAQRGLRVRRA